MGTPQQYLWGPRGVDVVVARVVVVLTRAVDDIDAVVASARACGAELVGEVENYEDIYRLCYARGPEGIIVELAEPIG